MITIQQLTVSYKEHIILKDLNLELEEGCIHGIVGLNGSGKTTLLNTIYGLKKQDSGSLLFQNHPLFRKNIAYLETENFFYQKITGQEYVDLFPNKSFDLQSWNQLFQLPMNQLIENYSTGMRKKLALLAVFKLNKEILILDEPFNGLDMEFSQTLLLILHKLKSLHKTILITSHILDSITPICDYIHLLQEQKITASISKENFGMLEDLIFKELKEEKQLIIDEILEDPASCYLK